MIYIDIQNQAENITPVRLRSYELYALLHVLNEPYNTVLSALYAFAWKKRYEMAFTGQVVYLEHVLNDQFDPDYRRIHIGDSGQQNFVIYNDVEQEDDVYMFNDLENEDPLYLFSQSEVTYTFIIYVPVGFIADYDRFRSWVDKYKLKSKKYIIIEE